MAARDVLHLYATQLRDRDKGCFFLSLPKSKVEMGLEARNRLRVTLGWQR